MAQTAVAVDRLKTFEVGLDLAAKIAFNEKVVGRDRVDDLVELFWRQILCTDGRINVGLFEDLLRPRASNAVDVRQRVVDPFISRDFNSK